MQFYENLTNTTFSSAFSVHLPDQERGKGQRHSNIAVSAFYICNKLNRCLGIFLHMVLAWIPVEHVNHFQALSM